MDAIKKYYWFQFFNGLAFFSPVIVIFWQSNGLSMAQIMLLQSIYSIGVVILELPTGAFADYFGKRKSLIIGALFWTIGLFWYGFSHNFWQFIIGELLAGVGCAFISGADRAYIHETLKEREQENDFKKVEGKARGVIQIAQSAGNLVGGLIASISLGLTLIATSITGAISFLVAFSFPVVKNDNVGSEKPNYVKIIKESATLIKNHKRLLWLTIFYAAFNGLVWPTAFYSQPFLKMLNIPVFYFGIIFAAFNLVAAYGSTLTSKFEEITKNNQFKTMAIIVIGLLFLIVVRPSIYTFPLWSLFLTLVFMNQTIISDQVLKIIPANKAATVLSFQSLIRRLSYAVVGPVLGIATDKFGIQNSLLGYAVFLTFVFGSILLVEKKFN